MDIIVSGIENATTAVATEAPASKKAAMKAVLEADKGFANCATIGFNPETGRIEAAMGIVLEERTGRDKSWFALGVGPLSMPRDGGQRGALHHFVGNHAVMVAAEVAMVETEKRGVFDALRQPTERLPYTVVKVDAMLPMHGVDEKPTLVGIVTSGKTLLSFVGTTHGHRRNEALVQLDKGESVTILLDDGTARRFVFGDVELAEVPVTATEYAKALVEAGHTQLKGIASIKDADARDKVETSILHRVANALGTSGMSQEGRSVLISGFFKKLENRQIDVVHRKLYAIIAEQDNILLPMLRNGGASEQKRFHRTVMPPVSMGRPSKPGLTPAQIAARKHKRAAEDRARAGLGAGEKKPKQKKG